MKEFEDFVKIAKQMEEENTQETHVSFVEGDSKTSEKYHESYSNGVAPLRVMVHGKSEVGAIVNHTPYSPDMDRSGGARVFKINPDLVGNSYPLYMEDLAKIASKISGVDAIPKNRV